MKKLYVLLMLITLTSFAQKELEIKISDIELDTYEDKEIGILIKYPKGWQVTKNIKKIGTKVLKDIAIIKKPGYFDHISLSAIELKKEEDFLKEAKQYKDNLIREITRNKEIGIEYRWLNDREKKEIGVNDGFLMGFDYIDKAYITNRSFLYFLRKDKKIYILEMYFELGKEVKTITPKLKLEIENFRNTIFKNVKIF